MLDYPQCCVYNLNMITLAIFIGLALWEFCGAIAALCAVVYLELRPSNAKLIAAMIAGPFAINRAWWLND